MREDKRETGELAPKERAVTGRAVPESIWIVSGAVIIGLAALFATPRTTVLAPPSAPLVPQSTLTSAQTVPPPVVLTVVPTPSTQLIATTEPGYRLNTDSEVFADESEFNKLVDALDREDILGFMNAENWSIMSYVNDEPRVRVLTRKIDGVKVEILDGRYAGQSGWILPGSISSSSDTSAPKPVAKAIAVPVGSAGRLRIANGNAVQDRNNGEQLTLRDGLHVRVQQAQADNLLVLLLEERWAGARIWVPADWVQSLAQGEVLPTMPTVPVARLNSPSPGTIHLGEGDGVAIRDLGDAALTVGALEHGDSDALTRLRAPANTFIVRTGDRVQVLATTPIGNHLFQVRLTSGASSGQVGWTPSDWVVSGR